MTKKQIQAWECLWSIIITDLMIQVTLGTAWEMSLAVSLILENSEDLSFTQKEKHLLTIWWTAELLISTLKVLERMYVKLLNSSFIIGRAQCLTANMCMYVYICIFAVKHLYIYTHTYICKYIWYKIS